MVLSTPDQTRQGFVEAAFDLAYAETARSASEAALGAWTHFANMPGVARPFDNHFLYNFIELPPEKIMAFATDLKNTLIVYILPTLKGDFLIYADCTYQFSGRKSERSDLNIFGDVQIDCGGVVGSVAEPVAKIPLMALEVLQCLIQLPDGTKLCPECERLFFNPRKNARFCGDKCRNRNHYRKKLEGSK